MVFPFEECGTCRTCELSAHTSIQGNSTIKCPHWKFSKTRRTRVSASNFVKKRKGVRYVCDGCVDEEMPVCMIYGHKREQLRAILDEFLKLKEMGSS